MGLGISRISVPGMQRRETPGMNMIEVRVMNTGCMVDAERLQCDLFSSICFLGLRQVISFYVLLLCEQSIQLSVE